jgi:biotin synthase
MGVLHSLIRVAVGTASVLGLHHIRMKVEPKTAHLMTYGKCIHDCKFCTQARGATSDDKLLSRISWPAFEDKRVFSALAKNQEKFKRVCIQVVRTEDEKDHIDYVKSIKDHCQIPLSVDLKAYGISEIRNTFSAGADCVGLPIDCANSGSYSEIKKGTLSSQIQLIEQAAAEYPQRISTHIMVGLGESEKEVVTLINRMHQLDVTTGLFAFTPIKGTALEGRSRPDPASYRRVQIARYLIYRGFDPRFEFDTKGRIAGYGYPMDELRTLIDPSAFETTGCRDCNRPYYNESPGGVMYNYPKELSSSEFKAALKESLNYREAGRE